MFVTCIESTNVETKKIFSLVVNCFPYNCKFNSLIILLQVYEIEIFRSFSYLSGSEFHKLGVK